MGVFHFESFFVLGLPPADLGGADELADLENGRGLLHLCSHTSGQYNINQSRMQHHIGLLHGLFWRALFFPHSSSYYELFALIPLVNIK